MTRKFVHLILLVCSLFLISCSMFSSDSESSSVDSEIEAETSDLGEEEGGDDFSDLDVEEAEEPTSVAATEGEDSFNDIENFNEGLIENELSDEDMGSNVADTSSSQDEFDVETAAVEPAQPAEANTATTITPAEEASVVTGQVTSSADNKITNLEYKSFDASGTVVISAEKAFSYQVREEPQYNQTIIEVADVVLPERFKLPYIAKDFGQAVATVNAYQEAGSSTARFVIQYKSKVKPTVQLRDNTLMVMNSTQPGSYVADASMTTTLKPSGSGVTVIDETGSGPAMDVTGKKISIEFYDTDIKSVIQYIADEAGVNLIIDNEVNGVVNVRLRNIGWEEGLAQILNSHGLRYERRGQLLRIAKVDTITREIREAQDRIKAEEENAKVTLPKIMKVIPINYGDLQSFEKQISPLLDGTNEKVTSDLRSNSIVVTGYPKTIKRVEQLVKSLDIEPLQVMIEGKIIEANTEFGREFGIRWTSSTTFGEGVNQGTLTSTISGTGNPANPLGGLAANLSMGSVDVLGDLTALLSIFEREQKIKVLSSPKITVLNKETARIRQTTQVPIINSTAQAGVAGNLLAQQVTFQPIKLTLDVTPQISANSDMILDIKVDRDVAGAAISGGSIPVNERNASTKIRVRDGESAVLGGIFNMDERMIEVGVPWLKDIPILGFLFKSKSRELSKNELVVFLYPRILKSTMRSQTEMSQGGDLSIPSGSSNDTLEKEFESL